jgi:hypothetical protein
LSCISWDFALLALVTVKARQAMAQQKEDNKKTKDNNLNREKSNDIDRLQDSAAAKDSHLVMITS